MEFIERFQEAIRIKTFWPKDAVEGDSEAEKPLVRFQEFLAEAFPAFNKAAERWVLNPYSVIYRWPGSGSPDNTGLANAASDNDREAKAQVLFLAHYDVVPSETEKWTVDPFGAEKKDGYVYGRGTLDMKGILAGLMEAAEQLCARGFKPRRDIWFAFGGDEERQGILGAREAAKWLAARGESFEWILDEGTPVGEKQIKGIDSPVALVSIEEKGFLSLDLTVTQEPGHASRPPNTQAAAVLARALCRIAKRPFPFRLIPTIEEFFREAGALIRGAQGFAMRHARLLGPLFFKAVSSSPTIASMLRTTTAMTQLEGSPADNVMPSEVRAVLNLRLLDPWTVESAIEFIRETIKDERVRVSVHGLATNPVPANLEHTKRSGPGWKEMEKALSKAYPGVPMMVFVMVAATDSRHFQNLAKGIFRFGPHQLEPKEMARVHGHDERISEENLLRGLRFYSALFEEL